MKEQLCVLLSIRSTLSLIQHGACTISYYLSIKFIHVS
jgi:hypothetical protein